MPTCCEGSASNLPGAPQLDSSHETSVHRCDQCGIYCAVLCDGVVPGSSLRQAQCRPQPPARSMVAAPSIKRTLNGKPQRTLCCQPPLQRCRLSGLLASPVAQGQQHVYQHGERSCDCWRGCEIVPLFVWVFVARLSASSVDLITVIA
jgi:hypothetical protein